ncbi:serine/threonine-protein kinase TBK1 isoform X2 [Atheta coriaria]
MAYLRGSANHVWCTTSVLGKGATGAVYQGVNKNNGEPVAVKTFNQVSHMRPQEVQMREFEVLKKVNHKNIVKLLAIEEEQESRGKVIVMELCTGGSLYNILDDPENTYGLDEKEFLLVLDHLSAGMKHLRDNSLVHRDLKPGNIMKFICDDGSTIYKLTDFGAARELQEGQQFNSLYGTEEYLHPDMYERAVLKKPPGRAFGATVDLWSIGVTLYHVATGNLPFRPYGGRRNRETMYYITTRKESGVISGIQTEEKGAITWGRVLPTNCQLSAGLKELVTPLLAGLLEADQNRIWSFEKFFDSVMNILSRRIINVFHVNRAVGINIYIDPDETYENLQNHIAKQTEIQPNNQILLYKDTLFVDIVGENTRADGYVRTNNQETLILFSKENNNVSAMVNMDIQKFPEFANLVSVENDAGVARTACSIGHMCKRRVESISLSTNLMKHSVDCFTKYIKNDLKTLHNKCAHLKEITSSHQSTTNAYALTQEMVNALSQTRRDSRFTELSSELAELSANFLSGIETRVQKIYDRNVKENTLQLEWEAAVKAVRCPWETKAPARARTLVDRSRDSWQHLVRDRATRSLSYNDEQFHVLERIKIGETNVRMEKLLANECIPQYNQLAEFLGDWYKSAQTIFLQTTILQNDVQEYANKIEQFAIDLRMYNDQCSEGIKKILSANKKVGKKRSSKQKHNSLKDAIIRAESDKEALQALLEECKARGEQLASIIHSLPKVNSDM